MMQLPELLAFLSIIGLIKTGCIDPQISRTVLIAEVLESISQVPYDSEEESVQENLAKELRIAPAIRQGFETCVQLIERTTL